MNSECACLFIAPRDMIGAWAYLKFASMAAELRNKNIISKIIEPAIENLSIGAIIKLVGRCNAKIVCIGVQPSGLPDAYQLIKEIQLLYPEIIITVEGYHINADPEIILELNVPFGFRGDVEFSFATFCEAVLQQKEIDLNLPGLVSNINGNLKIAEYALVKQLDRLPNPAVDLLAIGKYFSASHNQKAMFVNTSRGCPYKCNFCANASQLIYRYFSVGRIIEQLKELENLHGVEWVEFLDLTFTINKSRTRELCQAIIENKLNIKWSCQTRVDSVDESLLDIMFRAGCRKIAFGVESGSEKIRNGAIKPISNIEYLQVFEMCNNAGIKTMANFVLGHPDETLEDMQATVDFALRLKPFNAVFIRMVPLPDVEVFEIGIREKKFGRNIWREYMRGEVEHPLYHSSLVTTKQVDLMYRKAFLRFYFSPRTMINYLPLFVNPLYLYRTVRFFVSIVFGSTKFSYC